MASTVKNKVVVVGGPTASGKSAIALDVAREFDGVIINADSMQIYDGLHIITARPNAEDEQIAPHRLYGVMDPVESCSAGTWETMAIAEIKQAWSTRKLPVICGGTGLYIKALVEGLSRLPDVPEDIRQAVRARARDKGGAALYEELSKKDPEMATRLNPGDVQRLSRALEVFDATGISLAEHQRRNKPTPKLRAAYQTHVLIPERKILYERCDRRFDQMLSQGALEEVKAFARRELDPSLPAMKALGVPELMGVITGKWDLETAKSEAQQQTRRFAKRQCTWFKNQISEAELHHTQYSESLRDNIYKKIRQFLLTDPH